MKQSNLLLTGCGILKKEIRFLAKKNNWELDTLFLDSSLHCDFGKLSRGLTGTLNKSHERDVIVFYGSCHPLMEKILDNANTFRTVGQNCVEMLLGEEQFTQELSNGAYFLLQDWAKRWKYIIGMNFGNNLEIFREIIKGDRTYLLGIRTPCSDDFRLEAESASKMAELPLNWIDVSLEHLEAVVQEAINKKRRKER